MGEKPDSGKKYGKLIKALQIISFVFMLDMFIAHIPFVFYGGQDDLY